MAWLELQSAIGWLLIAFVIVGSCYYVYTIFDCVKSIITRKDEWNGN